MTSVLARVVFVIALGFTLIGSVEVAFILADYASGGAVAARVAPDLELGIRSWTVHHAMRPGYDIPPVRTNSFGLRSPEVKLPKPAGTFRILLLGDSFTFGFQASEETVFGRLLEQRLRRLPGLESVEIVNAGVLSYCPLLEYLQYRHSLHVLQPDLVILNFDMSDVQDHLEYSRSAAFDSNGDALFVREPTLGLSPSRVPALISFRLMAQYVRAATRNFESQRGGVPFTRDLDRYLWAVDKGPEMDREVEQTLKPIASLAKLLRHDRIPLVLATYPQPWQVSGDATPLPPIRDQYGIGTGTVHLNDRAFRKLESFARREDIRFVNATQAFREAADPAHLFLASDFHFSPAGNELYAAVLEQFLRGESVLPLQP
jgi:lysophospholipase L1-like esterase